MLCKAKILKGFDLVATDGKMGKVKEFYFDDRHWTIRYLVAETGNWLINRQVLISPYALGTLNQEDQLLGIGLSKKQIEDSPSLDTQKPVSRQFEESYYSYYGWPTYWDGPNIWGSFPYLMPVQDMPLHPPKQGRSWDPFLRSSEDVTGHFIQAVDGEIGHVEDFIIDTQTWTIRYLVIDTQNWWPGRKVLVSPQWIERISWSESKVFFNLTRESIRTAPEYTEGALVTREYETWLHRHYDRQGYWIDDPENPSV